jgi:hypothetical protein
MLLPFFEWMQNATFSTTIQESWWMGAAVNIAHLLALVVFAGGVLVVDLRLLGVGLTQQSVKQVAEDARPWLVGGLLGLFLTGLPQLFSLAIRNYYNFFFWFKMTVLLLAVIYTFTIRQRVVAADEGRVQPIQLKLVGLISIALWLAVVIPARMIGLS